MLLDYPFKHPDPCQQSFYLLVSAVRQKLQVLWPVVLLVAVLVVDVFPGLEGATKHFCHHKAVFVTAAGFVPHGSKPMAETDLTLYVAIFKLSPTPFPLLVVSSSVVLCTAQVAAAGERATELDLEALITDKSCCVTAVTRDLQGYLESSIVLSVSKRAPVYSACGKGFVVRFPASDPGNVANY